MYKIGAGEPIFVMPYPHAFNYCSMAEDHLTNCLINIDKQVITFDPPMAYRSDRPARYDLAEMLDCTKETLQYFNINEKIDFIGHSMGGLCSIAFCLENPLKVKRLILVGSTSGYKAIKKYSIHKKFTWKQKQKWQLIFWQLLTLSNLASMKTYKKMFNLVGETETHNQTLFHPLKITQKDNKIRQPARMKWAYHSMKIDVSRRLKEIQIPVFIVVGRYDPTTPTIMSEELHRGIENSQMVVLENSGHSPFYEEPEQFSKMVQSFLSS